MDRGRASAAIAVILFGHVAALASQRELWPFSNYPMYSKPQSRWGFEANRVVGISPSGAEVAIDPQACFPPYGYYGLSAALDAVASDPTRLDATLRALLSWYEARRPLHGGPPIRGLRAYRVEYSFSRQLDPRKRERATAGSRVLLAEVGR